MEAATHIGVRRLAVALDRRNKPEPILRILHTIPGVSWGGLEQRAVETAIFQAGHGHDVAIATPEAGTVFRRATAAGLNVQAMDFHQGWGPKLLLSLREIVKRHDAELLDTHCNRDSGAVIGCLDLAAIVRSRHSKNHQPKHSVWRRLRWRASYDHVIATAAAIRDELVEERVVLPENVSVIGEWAGEDFFDDAANRQRAQGLRELHNVPAGIPLIAALGVMRVTKGYEYLLRAAAILKARGVDFRCMIIGGSRDSQETPHGYYADLMTLAASLGIENETIFTGFVEDVAGILQLPDIVVVPSVRESQTRVIPQAFACGKPVVAYAVGGIPELVIPGRTGTLVTVGNVEEMADALQALLAEPGEIQRLGRGARSFADTELRFSAMMGATLAAYERAIAHGHSRPFRR